MRIPLRELPQIRVVYDRAAEISARRAGARTY
jgi:hypothetical protein